MSSKGDLSKALARLFLVVAKGMGKKLLPSSLQDNKIMHIIEKARHGIVDPAQLVDLAIKVVVDASPCGNIKKVYLVSKALYDTSGALYVCMKIHLTGGFVGVGTAFIVDKIAE